MTPTQLQRIRFAFGLITLFIGIVALTVWSGHATPKKRFGSVSQPARPSENITTSNIQHVPPPKSIKGIYMTSWVVTNIPWRNRLADFIDQSELNAVVIDIKDYSGFITFDTQDDQIKRLGVEEVRNPDLKQFIHQLHQKNIYVIARITVFQDPYYAKLYPKQAVQTRSGTLWQDRNGLHYIDPGSIQYWDYIVRLAKAAERIGFDELNFDYVRYPTDGNMADIRYPISGPTLSTPLPKTPSGDSPFKTQKEWVLRSFFAYLRANTQSLGIPISADLFGMTMTASDDVTIGQTLEGAAPYFDYICPMVYPSHYPKGFNGYTNPADHPYALIHHVMTAGAIRMKKINQPVSKLRPWLQDFNLGATYDDTKVRAQIDATNAAGISSWLMWDARNRYTKSAYKREAEAHQ